MPYQFFLKQAQHFTCADLSINVWLLKRHHYFNILSTHLIVTIHHKNTNIDIGKSGFYCSKVYLVIDNDFEWLFIVAVEYQIHHHHAHAQILLSVDKKIKEYAIRLQIKLGTPLAYHKASKASLCLKGHYMKYERIITVIILGKNANKQSRATQVTVKMQFQS
mgnify:FL=1